ncbi:MAG: hypothetical protein WC872_00775 [Candidatus Absconditabacterales bacterium]
MKNIENQQKENIGSGDKKLEKNYDELRKNIDKVKFNEDNDSTKEKIKSEMLGLKSEIAKQTKIEKKSLKSKSSLDQQNAITKEIKKIEVWIANNPERPAKEIGQAAINILSTIENSPNDPNLIAKFIGKIMNTIWNYKNHI